MNLPGSEVELAAAPAALGCCGPAESRLCVLPLSKLLLSKELWRKPEQGQKAQCLGDGTAAPP